MVRMKLGAGDQSRLHPTRTAGGARAFTLTCALAGAVVAAGATGAAFGAEPQLRARYDDWAVYVRALGSDQVCYVLSEAVDKSPKNVDHGQVVMMVSTWRSGAARQQPSVRVSYDLKTDSPTTARVGSSRFAMFVDGSDAFLSDDEDERRLVAAMKRGFDMRVETFSTRGTATSYEFSLRGVTRALDSAAKACA